MAFCIKTGRNALFCITVVQYGRKQCNKKMIQFSGDVSLPAIGQGTWYMGEDASQRKTEVAALRAGIELGLTLIDTAEMYADGGAEKWLGKH